MRDNYVQLEKEKIFAYDIQPGKCVDIALKPRDPPAFFTFNIETQSGNGTDDIIVKVLDEVNHAKWEIISKAPQPYTLPPYICYLNVKVYFGTIIFLPPESCVYYLLLDNSHSTLTTKHVGISINILSFESEMRRIAKEAVKLHGLNDFWRTYEDTEKHFDNGKYSTACDSARKALIVLWIKVGESLSRTKIVLDESKSPDIKPLREVLKAYAPNYMISQITQAWALASELSHPEKREGTEPTKDETRFALNSAFSAIAYLCSLLPKQ
jgi:hypothetical protein